MTAPHPKAPPSRAMLHEVSCDTAEEFVEELLPTRSSWLRTPQYGVEYPLWLYRGQANAKWPLQPKVLREGQHLQAGEWHRISEIGRWVPGQVSDRLPGPMQLARKELAFVIAYCQKLHETGLPIPDNSPELRNLDLNEIDLHNFPPPVYRAAFALAQHYGIPTRLLDWSTRPLVAAYFAARDVARARCEESADCAPSDRLVVWALNWDFLPWLRKRDPGVEFVSAPSSSNPNLQAQAGLFTLVRFGQGNARALQEHPPPLDELIRAASVEVVPDELLRSPALVKVTVPCTEARALLRLLSEYNVSAAQVFPGFQGAADALYERRWWQWARIGDRS